MEEGNKLCPHHSYSTPQVVVVFYLVVVAILLLNLLVAIIILRYDPESTAAQTKIARAHIVEVYAIQATGRGEWPHFCFLLVTYPLLILLSLACYAVCTPFAAIEFEAWSWAHFMRWRGRENRVTPLGPRGAHSSASASDVAQPPPPPRRTSTGGGSDDISDDGKGGGLSASIYSSVTDTAVDMCM
ncbi:hypothetical protein FOA52_011936 [Chlamydomonas sp. UWO 241]|nr:hypothetical protein FOA52_011936 [Chlamydomonas sp. UWO 241]